MALCELCGGGARALGGALGPLLGPLDAVSSAGHACYVHRLCILWSPEVYQTERGTLKNVVPAIKRGRQIRCSHCGKRGATVGCRIAKCHCSFHLLCAKDARCRFNTQQYVVACPDHASLFRHEQPQTGEALPGLEAAGPEAPGPDGGGAADQRRQRQPQPQQRDGGEPSSKRRRLDSAAVSAHLAAAKAAMAQLRPGGPEEGGLDEDDLEFAARERKRLAKERARLQPVILAAGRSAAGAAGGLQGEGGPQQQQQQQPSLPGIAAGSEGFASVGGAAGVVAQLREMVLLPLAHAGLLAAMGVRPPRGILLHGLPGTGKTHVVRCLAAEVARQSPSPVAFFARKAADCLGKYHGDAELSLRLLFQMAEAQAPSIIFLDELDALVPARSVRAGTTDQIYASVVSTLLALMDGLHDRGQVVVIAATNRPDSIDPALRRPGRFDREVFFGLPSPADRQAILQVHTRHWRPQPAPALLRAVSQAAEGFAGADLAALCSAAVLCAVRRVVPALEQEVQAALQEQAAAAAAAQAAAATAASSRRDGDACLPARSPELLPSQAAAGTPLPEGGARALDLTPWKSPLLPDSEEEEEEEGIESEEDEEAAEVGAAPPGGGERGVGSRGFLAAFQGVLDDLGGAGRPWAPQSACGPEPEPACDADGGGAAGNGAGVSPADGAALSAGGSQLQADASAGHTPTSSPGSGTGGTGGAAAQAEGAPAEGVQQQNDAAATVTTMAVESPGWQPEDAGPAAEAAAPALPLQRQAPQPPSWIGSVVVEERDWWAALAKAPLPCSQREATAALAPAAATGAPGGGWPAYALPLLAPPLADLLLRLRASSLPLPASLHAACAAAAADPPGSCLQLQQALLALGAVQQSPRQLPCTVEGAAAAPAAADGADAGRPGVFGSSNVPLMALLAGRDAPAVVQLLLRLMDGVCLHTLSLPTMLLRGAGEADVGCAELMKEAGARASFHLPLLLQLPHVDDWAVQWPAPPGVAAQQQLAAARGGLRAAPSARALPDPVHRQPADAGSGDAQDDDGPHVSSLWAVFEQLVQQLASRQPLVVLATHRRPAADLPLQVRQRFVQLPPAHVTAAAKRLAEACSRAADWVQQGAELLACDTLVAWLQGASTHTPEQGAQAKEPDQGVEEQLGVAGRSEAAGDGSAPAAASAAADAALPGSLVNGQQPAPHGLNACELETARRLYHQLQGGIKAMAQAMLADRRCHVARVKLRRQRNQPRRNPPSSSAAAAAEMAAEGGAGSEVRPGEKVSLARVAKRALLGELDSIDRFRAAVRITAAKIREVRGAAAAAAAKPPLLLGTGAASRAAGGAASVRAAQAAAAFNRGCAQPRYHAASAAASCVEDMVDAWCHELEQQLRLYDPQVANLLQAVTPWMKQQQHQAAAAAAVGPSAPLTPGAAAGRPTAAPAAPQAAAAPVTPPYPDAHGLADAVQQYEGDSAAAAAAVEKRLPQEVLQAVDGGALQVAQAAAGKLRRALRQAQAQQPGFGPSFSVPDLQAAVQRALGAVPLALDAALAEHAAAGRERLSAEAVHQLCARIAARLT